MPRAKYGTRMHENAPSRVSCVAHESKVARSRFPPPQSAPFCSLPTGAHRPSDLTAMSKASARPPITKGILKLAKQINDSDAPGFVTVEPGDGCLPDCCFENVPAVVKRRGGSVQAGWKMREESALFVQGDFHAVWRRPDGTLVDVTPRKDLLREILFLPDSRMDGKGADVEPRRMVLQERPCYCGSGMSFKMCCGLAGE